MGYSECRSEQEFKMEWIRRNKDKFLKLFCIETEETVDGFPDVLAIREADSFDAEGNKKRKVQTVTFIEFKFARNGWIKFRPSQPAFYKANKELDIEVCALCEHKGKFYIHGFYVSELFRESSMYKMNDKNMVNLKPMTELLMNGGEVE